ncbi:MAG: endolytic transglycosylase MltG [Candidatus Merdivicinus sp.]|jgi:UPF0755 protein
MDDDNKKKAGEEWVDQILRDIHSEQSNQDDAFDSEKDVNPPVEEEPTGHFDKQPRTTEPVKPKSHPTRKSRTRHTRVKRVGILTTFLYLGISIGICVAASIFCLNAVGDILAISRPNAAVQVEIPEGTDTAALGKILKEAGLIEYPWMFEIVAKYEGMGEIASGTYVLNQNMGYNSLMNAVEKSQQPRKTVSVTIPEGLTLTDISQLMEENNVCKATDFMQAVQNTDFGFDFEDEIPDDDLIYYHLEGYLFPDTYEFYENENALNVIRKMMDNFKRKITPQIRAQMLEQDMSLHELLTLASIIQAEAPDVENMAMVSSVYHNRLNNPSEYPRLQADPTRKYADEEISVSVGVEGKKIVDAYNTYEGEGLPPGPINNPGMAAIEAALNPAETNYYYFCSNLKTRQFYYAETLEEHEQNLVKANLK